jgi:Ca2+-binding RTX toxin-like protein
MANTFTRFDQSFENDFEGYIDETNGWDGTITIVPSGTGGIASPDGSSHAIFTQTDGTGPFTRFDGYRSLDDAQGFTTQITIYLNPSMPAGEGFDYSVAANGQNGAHVQDFIFHVTSDTSTGELLIGASNNTNFDPREDLETVNHGTITTAGWYTFEHVFSEDLSDGTLTVTMRVRDDGGNVVFTQVLDDNNTDFATEFGGNRYGWFTNIDVSGGILVDNSVLLTEDDNPVQVFDGNTIIGTYETIEDAKTAIDNGDIAGAALEISTTGLDDAFFYVADGMSIQAAVDAADAGDMIMIAAGTFNESVNIDKHLDIAGAGVGQTIVTPPTGNGFSIIGDLGTDSTLSIDGIEFLDSPNGSGIAFDDNAILGTLEITNSEFEGNFRNGVAIGGNSNPVDLDNIVITDTDFIGNGGDPASQTSSGDGDLLFFQYYGDATLTNLNITGVSVGSGPAENAIQFRGDAGSLGNVSISNVSIDGVYEKQPIAFFNYDDVLGLSSNNVVITADSTSFQISGNFDGIGGDIDFAAQDIDVTGAPDPIALQGNDDSQLITSGAEDSIIRGGGGDDTLSGGGGDDLGTYAGSRSDFTLGVTSGSSGFVTAFTGVTDNNAGDGDEGDDVLSGIEALSFAASATVLDLTQSVQLFDGSDALIGTFDTLKEAVDAASSGHTIRLAAGVHDSDSEQIVIDKDLTIIGAGKETTTFEAAFDTGTSGNARGWFLVTEGTSLDVSGITFDGAGHDIWQAFRHLGSGTFDNVAFTDIEYQESGSPYQGTAIAVFGSASDVDVTNSMFSDIGRIGVLYFGAGVTGDFMNNIYEGKGNGDFLDYALDISAGAAINVIGNTVFNNRGVASSDGSQSAAFLVTTFFGGGTNAVFQDNTLTNNTSGVFVGFDSTDASSITFLSGNAISGGVGVQVRGNGTVAGSNLVDGTFNWIGGDADNAPSGSFLADNLVGGVGNDTLTGNDGMDTLEGDAGNDLIIGGAGADSIDGGADTDTVSYSGSAAAVAINLAAGSGSGGDAAGDTIANVENIIGSAFNDVISGNADSNDIQGAAGNDLISGLVGGDTLSGDAGLDTLDGGVGNDMLLGGDDNDSLIGSFGNDTMDGGADNDTLAGENGFDSLLGGSGDDSLLGDGGNDRLDGGDDNDILSGGFGFDRLEGGSGNDLVQGDSGNDTLRGAGGSDTLEGGTGVDVIFGGSGGDVADGGAGNDRIRSESGNDTVNGGGNDDRLFGSFGFDSLMGDDGNDFVNGDGGNDTLEGGAGADTLIGSFGFDSLNGGTGADNLQGSTGNDTVTGGGGDDVFLFALGDDNDVYTDFIAGAGTDDVIELSGFGAAFDEFSEVFAAASQQGANVVIDFGGGDTITLLNTTLGDLHEDDFIFS